MLFKTSFEYVEIDFPHCNVGIANYCCNVSYFLWKRYEIIVENHDNCCYK